MKHAEAWSCSSTLVLSVLAAAIQPVFAAAGPELSVPPARELITIDGRLTEDQWKEAAVVDSFSVLGEPGVAPQATTTVRALADDEALHFGFICQKPLTSNIVATATEDKDAQLWLEDCVEVFLQPAGDE